MAFLDDLGKAFSNAGQKTKDMADIAKCNSNLEAYLKSFWAYGVYGWIAEWIKRGMIESGQELLKLFKNAQGNTI